MSDDIHIIRPQGRLDETTRPAFEKELNDAFGAGKQRLLLDFADLSYISSAGLRIVLSAAKRMSTANGKLALCSLNPQIAEVFQISGFNTILDIHPSADSARARLGAD